MNIKNALLIWIKCTQLDEWYLIYQCENNLQVSDKTSSKTHLKILKCLFLYQNCIIILKLINGIKSHKNLITTFRKSIVLCLESRVLSILTGIFAFIDTNRNLDILVKNTSQNWSVSLWLDIWNNLDITQIRYEDMVSPTKHLEVMEVATKTTSVEGKLFSAKMPFSWLAFEQIRNIMRNVIDSEENKGNIYVP